MTQLKPGVVNLNQQLTLTALKTTQIAGKRKEDIQNPKLLLPVSSNFNFNEDRVEFVLNINNEDVEIQNQTVFYKFSKYDPVTVPIISSHQKKEDNVITITIHASIKDRLLYLFEKDQKEFLLTVFYTDKDKKKYASSYSVSLPKVFNQGARPAERKFMADFNPENLKCGIELKMLYENHFNSYKGITYNEQLTLESLKSYQVTSVADRFSKFDFLTMFQYMIAIEDMECVKQIHGQSLNFAKIYSYNSCPGDLKNKIEQYVENKMKNVNYTRTTHVIKVMNKLPDEAKEFSSVYIYDESDYTKCRDDCKLLFHFRMNGKIEHIFDNIILVKISPTEGFKDLSSINNISSYRIEFVPNRVSIRIVQKAIAYMKDKGMKSYLENFETLNVMNRRLKEMFDKFEWLSPTIKNNSEQMLAVKNIVNCTSFPSPFIIFGGPGTGKSTTIVEAIAQIVKMKPNCHILFTAGSNSTCDDIGNRLAKYISVNKILRIHAASFDQKKDKICKFPNDISNFRSLRNSSPSYTEFMTARVVIVTIISAGRIINDGYPVNHFDYIFIDEAGFVSEPESYIPLCGLKMSMNGIQIVLAGDHKQLSPVINNPFAKDLGLEVSLMERLMNNDKKYSRSENGYDHNYVVQLKKNYRNHPAIMRFSNENFYNSQLVSMQTERMKHSLITNEEFPVIFHGSTSPSEKVGTSLKNEGELTILKTYIIDLLENRTGENRVQQSDIGIISPYSAQRNKMIQKFGKQYPNIEIGTVDSFQGREKKIIIISCVRSGTNDVGFLSNEKRLNVALTRAKLLLIVIGNAETLQNSEIWHKFIMYCYRNKATIGDLKGFDRIKITDKNSSHLKKKD